MPIKQRIYGRIDAFILIKQVYTLVIVCKAFTMQQEIGSPESVSHACGGDLTACAYQAAVRVSWRI